MRIVGAVFGLFLGIQGIRAVLNGHLSLGCVAITAAIVMFGTAWILSAKAANRAAVQPNIRGITEVEVKAILVASFALFFGAQGVRAVLNGHDVLGCVAITAAIVMFGTAWILSAKAESQVVVQPIPSDYLAGMTDAEVSSSWRATLLGQACPPLIAPDCWRSALCAEMMRRGL